MGGFGANTGGQKCLDTADNAENVVFIQEDLYLNEKPDQPVDYGHYLRKEQW